MLMACTSTWAQSYGEAVRYRLGVEAQHRLNGEYTADELQTVYLHPPG